MKVLFHFSVIERFYARVALELARRHPDWSFSGICNGRQERDRVVELGPAWTHLELISSHIASPPEEPDMAFLRELEERYGIPNLYLMAEGDWFVKDFPRERMLRWLEAVARMVLSVLDEVEPDVVVLEGIDCVTSNFLYGVCRSRGIPFLTPAAGRLPDRTAFIRNRDDRWERTEELFRRYREEELPEEARARARSFIEEFREKHLKPGYYRTVKRPSFGPSDVGWFVELWREHRKDPDNYVVYSPTQVVWNRIRRVARRLVADRTLFQEPDPADRFFIFPLHFQPEATTLVLAPFFVDQVALVRSIAISLPVGCWLYVKEHGYSLGRRPLSYYRRLREIPNVKLITPYVDSHPLIRASEGVTTITGTMGWEALLYEKPAITFGNAFYNVFPDVRHVEDLFELPDAMQWALKGHVSDRDALDAFVAATLEGSHRGVLAYRNSPEEFYAAENVGKVADALKVEMGGLCDLNVREPDEPLGHGIE